MTTAKIPVHINIVCLSKNRLYTKMLGIHLFSFFTIKTLRSLNVVKKLTHVI